MPLPRATAPASTPRSPCGSPAGTTSPMPSRRSAASSLAGFDAEACARGPRGLPGRRPPPRAQGRAQRRPHLRRLRPPPDRGRRHDRGGARISGARRLIAAFQPHLYSRTKALAAELGAALAAADEVAVLDVYPAREEPVGPLAGVSGLMVAEEAADHAGGATRLVAADRRAGRRGAAARGCGEGDLLITIGAGDINKLAEALVDGRRGVSRSRGVERDYPLSRLTTVRAGGSADFFARPSVRGRGGRAARLGRAARASRSASSGRAPTCSSPTRAFAAW